LRHAVCPQWCIAAMVQPHSLAKSNDEAHPA
jgi:hypothetical protein